MNASELRILLVDTRKRRDAMNSQRNALNSAAATHRAEAAEPHHNAFQRRAIRNQEIAALGAIQRLDTALYQADCEIRDLGRRIAEIENASDLKADHDEFFGRVRQIVAVSNVVPLPFASNSPEVA